MRRRARRRVLLVLEELGAVVEERAACVWTQASADAHLRALTGGEGVKRAAGDAIGHAQ